MCETSTGTIIDMSPFLSNRRFPELAELDAYWHALTGSRVMPDRAELDPRGIEGALSHCFVLQRLAPNEAKLRVVGQVLNALAGEDLRGMSLNRLFTPPHQDGIDRMVEAVCTTPGIARLSLSAERGRNRPALEARMALWPMRDNHGRPSRVLGGLSLQGAVQVPDHSDDRHPPRRFQIAAARLEPLQQTAPQPSRSLAGFAEAAPYFAAPPRQAAPLTQTDPATDPTPQAQHHRDAPYLRLVKDD